MLSDETALLKVLSCATLALSDEEAAAQHLRSALQLVSEPFIPVAAAGCLAVVAPILAEREENKRAVQLLGLAFTYSDSILMGWMGKWSRLTRLRDRLKADLGAAAYQATWARGTQLNLEVTVADVLDYWGDDPDAEAVDIRHQANQALIEPLTPRELEVLALLAQGHSNREIADALTVVVGTVKSHVYNICQKLEADNRTQAVLKAKELGLIR